MVWIFFKPYVLALTISYKFFQHLMTDFTQYLILTVIKLFCNHNLIIPNCNINSEIILINSSKSFNDLLIEFRMTEHMMTMIKSISKQRKMKKRLMK